MATFHAVLAIFVAAAFALFIPSAPAYAACAAPAGIAGDLVYNGDGKVFQYCDGTDWIRMHNRAGSGSGGCANPAKPEGQVVYNADYRVLQGCAGNTYRAFGPIDNDNAWMQVSGSGCAIRRDSTLWCWGENSNSQLGLGDAVARSSPAQVLPGSAWLSVSRGANHTCGIRADGTLWCWGLDTSNQLGNGAGTATITAPAEIATGTTWKAIAAGGTHSCAIKSDDTLWCWGNDTNGQVGDAANAQTKDIPRQVSGGGSWKVVAAGTSHSCGIKSDDTLWCWGAGGSGRIGDGGGVDRDTPSQVSVGTLWTHIALGDAHSCGVRSDNTGACWGAGANGRLGNNGVANSNTPSTIFGGHSWKKIIAGANGSCGIRADDTAMCWGFGFNGQIGNGAVYGYFATPQAVTGGFAFRDLGLGSSSGTPCGVELNGSILCWGSTINGSIPTGGLLTTYRTAPQEIAGASLWNTVSAGGSFACGIKSDNTLWCWGSDTFGRLGTTNYSGDSHTFPVEVSGGGAWSFIGAGPFSTCGIKNDSSLWCWGNDAEGQLGDGGGFANTTIPTAIAVGETWQSVSPGGSSAQAFTCGIKLNGSLWCWGADNLGQLGNGATTTTTQDAPVAAAVGQTWKKIATGGTHACAIRNDDTLWCWGSDANGQVGDGAGSGGPSPVQVGPGTSWLDISLGGGTSNNYTCGIQSGGSLWCWGADSFGKLGNGGTTGDQITPVQIAAADSWKDVSTGVNTACAIRKDDSLWCWGRNNNGQVADNTTTDRDVPTAVHGGGVWQSIEAGRGGANFCGMSKNKIYCWGDGSNGELGDGFLPQAFAPVQAWCGAPSGRPGTLKYNSDFSVLQYCDGAGWVAIGKGFNDIVTSGLVGFWKFDESGGTSATDSSGTGNHGTLTNFPASPWLPSGGQVNGALDFDGTNDFVDVPDDATLDFERTDSFSIAAWIYRDTSNTEDDIIEKVDTFYNGYALYLPEDSSGLPDDILIFGAKSPIGSLYIHTPTGSIPEGSWTHVAVTYGGTSVTSGVKIYVNGVDQTLTTTSSTLGGSILNNDSLKFGTDIANGACCEFDGKIDEVRIYNRILTAGEVAQLAGQ